VFPRGTAGATKRLQGTEEAKTEGCLGEVKQLAGKEESDRGLKNNAINKIGEGGISRT